MEKLEKRYKQRIAELEEQLKRASSSSELTNAEWLEKLRKKEEEHQKTLADLNKRHNEDLKEL